MTKPFDLDGWLDAAYEERYEIDHENEIDDNDYWDEDPEEWDDQ